MLLEVCLLLAQTYRVAGISSPAEIIRKVEPHPSEEATRLKASGTILLSAIVGENGRIRDMRVLRPAGLGLDEQVLQALAQWRFRPAMHLGKPIAIRVDVEVRFAPGTVESRIVPYTLAPVRPEIARKLDPVLLDAIRTRKPELVDIVVRVRDSRAGEATLRTAGVSNMEVRQGGVAGRIPSSRLVGLAELDAVESVRADRK